MNWATADVQASIARSARFPGRNFCPRFETTFNRVNGMVISFAQSLPPRHAAADGRHFRSEHPVLVLEIVDVVFLITFHAVEFDLMDVFGQALPLEKRQDPRLIVSRACAGFQSGPWSACLSAYVSIRRKFVLTLALIPAFSPGRRSSRRQFSGWRETIRPIPSHDISKRGEGFSLSVGRGRS